MKKLLSLMLVAVLLFGILALVGNIASASKGEDDIKKARKEAEEKLLPLEGISGISSTKDKIIVYIEHEKYRDKVPERIKGFKTEVKVIGRIKALAMTGLESITLPQYGYAEPVSRTGVVRPIVGGISVGVPEEDYGAKMAGTLAIVTSDPYILSCAHVIAMDKEAEFLDIGTPVLQPGTYDGGTLDHKVGELYKYIKIDFGPRGENYADAAIATIDSGIDFLQMEILGADDQNTYTISETAEVSVNDVVRKSGRTTGVTESSVTDTSATVKVYYVWPFKYAIFKDQILVEQPFIESGDSGSLVDKGGAFVGLAYAASEEVAVICKAKYIIEGLGITIADTTPPTISDLAASPDPFSPNGDGVKDTTTITATLSEKADWTLTIMDADGTTIRTFTGTGDSISQVWDGTDEVGNIVSDGTYTIYADAVDEAGNQATQVSTTVTIDTIPPAKVTGLTVTTVGSSQLDLSWDAISDAEHYNVYRSTTQGGPYDLVASPTTNSYSDTGLEPDTTYYYRVSAVDAAGNEGDLSDEASGTTAPANTMHVASIDMSYEKRGPNYHIFTVVKIVDADNLPVEGATVYVNITQPDGTTVSLSGDTNSEGTVTLRLKSQQTGTYKAVVVDVVKNGWTYDPTANVETEETLTIP